MPEVTFICAPIVKRNFLNIYRGTSLNFFYLPLFGFFLSLTAAMPKDLMAMNFYIESRDGREVLVATGPIELGDQFAYRDALEKTPVQPHGARVVYLDSPGGSVSAALAMSAVNDDFIVHMVIPSLAECASACASILFVSGAFRTMSPTGRFGQHSCSLNGIADADCNEELAQHAFRHGVAHGAVKAFVTYTSPRDISWFNTELLDCWGISYYPFSRESNFEHLDPCLYRAIKGDLPPGQTSWRVDMKKDGYRAFARPVSDSVRDFEVGIYCDENAPGQMFVDFDIAGTREQFAGILRTGRVNFRYDDGVTLPYTLEQVDNGFTRATFAVPEEFTRKLLTSTELIGVHFDVVPEYEAISSNVGTRTSQHALLFVANHCVNGGGG
jgi:hypothetical protein